MIKILSFVITSVISTSAVAKTKCVHSENSFHCVKILSVYDGDTVTVKIEGVHSLLGEKIGVRINGIDTPEIATKDKCEKSAGRIAKNLVESLIKNAKEIDLVNVQRDKYFRILADVKADDKLVSEVLLKNFLAVKYDGGTKQKIDWCDRLKNRVPASVGGGQ